MAENGPNLDELLKGLQPLASPMPFQELQIPDPNQLSIPSEPRVRGNFTDRLEQQKKGKSSSSLASILSGIRTTEKGADIVLRNILRNLNLPAELYEGLSIPTLDIMNLDSSKGSRIMRHDLKVGQRRQKEKEL